MEYSNIIGKIVKVIIDRPLGTYHPKHKDILYPVNYGYIAGIMAADGEEQGREGNPPLRLRHQTGRHRIQQVPPQFSETGGGDYCEVFGGAVICIKY